MHYYYDLHIHSALSPCGDDDMTPNNIVNMAALGGLDIIAISDHNTCGNLLAAKAVADKAGIMLVPAMELETAEEIHVLCLFASIEGALAFESEQVAPSLADIPNNPDIFGRQILMDSMDNIVGYDPRYLLNATGISIEGLFGLVKRYGGIAVPAHIDKQTKSILSVFGIVERQMGFTCLELSKNAGPDFVLATPCLKGENYNYIYNSDAHYLGDIFENTGRNYIELEKLDMAAFLNKILQINNAEKF